MVSVIIPCYNQAKFLSVAARSVLTQTYSDLECIIINDGSTDETGEVALALSSADARVCYVEQENRGLSAARNRGLDEARGDYVQFLDADDFIAPEKLELQLRALGGIDVPAVAYCDYYRCDENGLPCGPEAWSMPAALDTADPLLDMALRWETEICIPPHCWLFDARLFSDLRIRFDETLPNHEDWDCWMGIMAARPRLVFIDSKLAAYRYNGGGMTASHVGFKMRDGFIQAIRHQQELLQDDQEIWNALRAKIGITRRAYRHYSRAFRARLAVTGLLRRALNVASMRRALDRDRTRGQR